MTTPTPSPDATVPGAIPEEVLDLLCRLDDFTDAYRNSISIGAAHLNRRLGPLLKDVRSALASRAAPTVQPEAPGVEYREGLERAARYLDERALESDHLEKLHADDGYDFGAYLARAAARERRDFASDIRALAASTHGGDR